jgi:GTP-binding protein Era
MKAGFIALVGRPNVGKSTLLNAILGEKLAIASPRPKTTRNRILGIASLKDAQLAVLDTPGLYRATERPRSRLGQFMALEAERALEEVDLVVLVEAVAPRAGGLELKPGPDSRALALAVKRAAKPAILAFNKIDRLTDKRLLLPLIDAYAQMHAFAAVVPLSARSGEGVGTLVEECRKLLPEGDALYPSDMITDKTERWLAAELVREQLFLLTRQEIPYATAVSIDAFDEGTAPAAAVTISATVHVEKPAHKKIVVGKQGSMIREIGTRARGEIARLLGRPVHLRLFVRAHAGWSDDQNALRELGYVHE